MSDARPDISGIEPTGRLAAAPAAQGGGELLLVTGGGGFLGSHIVRKLLERGDRVRVLGRRPYPELAALGVDCRRGDIADAEAVRDAVEGCDGVIHSAAIPGVGGAYAEHHRINYVGTKNVVDAMRGCGVRRLVHTSTPSVVHGGGDIRGGDESLPYPERFSSPYAATKALAERYALAANSPDLAVAAIRPHLVFGPGDTQLIPKMLRRARAGMLRRVGGGRNLVSVSYVENVADAHLMAMDRLRAGGGAPAGQAYFINEPEPVNCWDFINTIVVGAGFAKITRSVPYPLAYAAGWLCEKAYAVLGRTGDPPVTRFMVEQLATDHWFRVDKAMRELAWTPRVTLEEGVRRLLADIGGSAR